MAQSLPRLSENRLSPLMDGYARALAERRIRSAAYSVLFLVITAVALATAEVDMAKFLANFGNFGSYFDRILTLENGQRVWTDPAEWFWGWKPWGALLLDTLLIAYLGTLFGAIGAFFLCFAATINLAVNPAQRFFARRFLEFCRTVPEIVFALIFVVAFGLGPVPGVLAIMIHTVGALGKLFAEVVENIDMKPVEGVSSTGASWAMTVRFAVVPQVLSGFLSYALVRFEVNVRGAAVMGFVGAGGIGQDLLEAIRKFYYSDVSALLVMIIATVVIIDLISERLRHRLLSMESAR
jgi:phosphonate transport system permease protein